MTYLKRLALALTTSATMALNSIAFAGRSNGVVSALPKISANRAVVIERGQPVCQIDLALNPDVAPKSIDPSLATSAEYLDGSEQKFNSLPPCNQKKFDQALTFAHLVDSKNQTAFLHVVGPVAICIVGGAVAGYIAYRTEGGVLQRSPLEDWAAFLNLMGTGAGVAAATGLSETAGVMLTAFSFGFVGMGCVAAGHGLGVLYYQQTHP